MTSFLKSLFCSAALLVLPGLSSAFAVQITMYTYIQTASGNYSFSPGTDFPALSYSDKASGVWNNQTWYGTFCVEMNEHFNQGGVYDVSFSNAASYGGVSTGPDGIVAHDGTTSDPLSAGTEALYRNFALGTLDTYLTGFHYENATDAANLQDLIWYLEGELPSLSGNPFATSLLGSFHDSWDEARKAFDGTTGVQVMNLTASDGRHQDQLVYLGVPDGGLTVMLLGISLAGIAVARRYAFQAIA